MSSPDNHPTRQQLAIRAAKEAGQIHLKYFGQPQVATDKNPRDIVTVADTEAERHILSLIGHYFSEDSILSEEAGATDRKSEFRWIVDPLDGTANFYKGSPDFCVLITVLQNDAAIYAVTWFPVTEELYVAAKGAGATCNGEPLRVSDESTVAATYGNTHMSSNLVARQANLALYRTLLFETRNIHVINACIARLLCDTASGRADFHFRVRTNFWDYAAGALLIEEAGGTVTDLHGNPFAEASSDVLATNGQCHAALVELIAAKNS